MSDLAKIRPRFRTWERERSGAVDRGKLWRQASKLLGDDAGIEGDPYGLVSHQGVDPEPEKAEYYDWARAAHRRHTFRTGSGDSTIWMHHSRGLHVREIGALVGLDWSWVAKRIVRIEAEIRETERRRAARPRTLTGLVADTDPLLLVEMLRGMVNG